MLKRGGRIIAGWCGGCGVGQLMDFRISRDPRPLLCIDCGRRQGAADALCEPWVCGPRPVSLLDWERASVQEAVEREAATPFGFDGVVSSVLARAAAYRAEVAAVRRELGRLGVRVETTDRGPVLAGNTAAVTAELLARVKAVREDLIGGHEDV